MTTQISSSGGATRVTPAHLNLGEAKPGSLSKAAGTVASSIDRISHPVKVALSNVIQPKGRTA